MLWLLLAILTAFFQSLKDVFSKIGLKKVDEYLAVFALSSFSVILLMPIVYNMKTPQLSYKFFGILLISGILNLIAIIIYMKSLKYSDISISAPMLTFTPIFLLLTSPILVGEFPKFLSIIGIIFIVIGSYVLNIKETHKGFFAPFKAIFNNKGPRLMLCVALIYSITSNFDKIGVQKSTPIIWGFSLNAFIAISVFPVVIYKMKKSKDNFRKQIKFFFMQIPIGVFNVLTLICQLTAIKFTLVAYVISIKRMSALLCVFWGYLIFKEKGLKERTFGAIIMIIGVFLIALS